MALLRFALLAVITLVLLNVVIGVATGATGAVEKAVLAAVGIGLLFAASRVRRLGTPRSA